MKFVRRIRPTGMSTCPSAVLRCLCVVLVAMTAPSAIAQQASLLCQNSASSETKPVRGPADLSATLQVSAEDDHAKDTHLCMADYKLLVTKTSAAEPQAVDFLTSDNDWGRKISVQLSGFSHDGKRILGMLSESGSAPMQQIFDYGTDDGSVRLFDLRKLAARTTGTRCLINAQITGTVEDGAMVIYLRSGKDCVHESQWLLSSENGPLHRLSRHASVLSLYNSASNVH